MRAARAPYGGRFCPESELAAEPWQTAHARITEQGPCRTAREPFAGVPIPRVASRVTSDIVSGVIIPAPAREKDREHSTSQIGTGRSALGARCRGMGREKGPQNQPWESTSRISPGNGPHEWAPEMSAGDGRRNRPEIRAQLAVNDAIAPTCTYALRLRSQIHGACGGSVCQIAQRRSLWSNHPGSRRRIRAFIGTTITRRACLRRPEQSAEGRAQPLT